MYTGSLRRNICKLEESRFVRFPDPISIPIIFFSFFFFIVAISHTHYTTKTESSVAIVETITIDISMIGHDIPRPFSLSRDITASGYGINISKNIRSSFENMKIPLNIILH